MAASHRAWLALPSFPRLSRAVFAGAVSSHIYTSISTSEPLVDVVFVFEIGPRDAILASLAMFGSDGVCLDGLPSTAWLDGHRAMQTTFENTC